MNSFSWIFGKKKEEQPQDATSNASAAPATETSTSATPATNATTQGPSRPTLTREEIRQRWASRTVPTGGSTATATSAGTSAPSSSSTPTSAPATATATPSKPSPNVQIPARTTDDMDTTPMSSPIPASPALTVAMSMSPTPAPSPALAPVPVPASNTTTSTSRPSPSPSPSPATVSTDARAMSISPTTTTRTLQSSSPTVKHVVTPSSASTPKRTKLDSSSSPGLQSQSQPQSSPTHTCNKTPSPRSAKRAVTPTFTPEQLEKEQKRWDYDNYCDIFKVTLDRSRASGMRTFLETTSTDLSEAQGNTSTPIFGRDELDTVIVERLGLPFTTYSTPLAYLLASYKRVGEIKQSLVQRQQGIAAGSVYPDPFPHSATDFEYGNTSLDIIANRIVNYCGLILQPDTGMVTDNVRVRSVTELTRLLEADPSLGKTLPTGWLAHLVQNYAGDEGMEALKELFSPILNDLLQLQPSYDLESTKKKLQSLIQLCRYGPLARLIIQHPNMLPPVTTGKNFQRSCVLGPLLSVICPSNDPTFKNATTRWHEIDLATPGLRAIYSSYQTLLFQLFKSVISDAPARESLVLWFARILRLNISLRRLHFDGNLVAGEDFMMNISYVLLHLSQPIVASSKDDKRMELVNLRYLLSDSHGHIDYDGVTRLYATATDVTNLRNHYGIMKDPYNFVTECFFETHEALHIGLCSIMKYYTQMFQTMNRIHDGIQRLDPNNPHHQLIKPQEEMRLEQLMGEILAHRVHLLDPNNIAITNNFYQWTCKWLVRQVVNSQPATSPTSSTASTTADVKPLYTIIPEYIIEDIVEFYTFVGHFDAKSLQAMTPSDLDGLIQMIITFSAGSTALKNTHLRGQFPDLLLLLLPRNKDAVSPIFSHPLLRSRLIPTFLELYVEAEFGRGQFFAKFTTRHHIAELFEYLWSIPEYQSHMIECSKTPAFIRFINMLANDVVYLLDDSLKTLSTIRNYQVEMSNTTTWRAQPPAVQREREENLHNAEGQATAELGLANSTVHMLWYMSKSIVEPFVCPEFVERMASITAYFIDKLVGKSVSELKVQNKEKYHFHPRTLLKEMIGILIHLSSSETFLEKVATDQRSYSKEVFAKASATIHKRGIMDPKDMAKFDVILEKLATLSESSLQLDEMLGDIPDEYLDAITSQLMADPVMLPKSKSVADRPTIVRHLMNNSTDPFNRSDLTVDMLVPMPELKQQIETFVETKKAEYREKTRLRLAAEDEKKEAYAQAQQQTTSSSDSTSDVNMTPADATSSNTTSSSSSSNPSSSTPT